MHPRDPRPARIAPLLAASLVALAACADAGADDERTGTAGFEQLQPGDAPALGDVVRASNAVGFELLEASDGGANAVVSPASFSLAFAMLAPGASGDAVDEMTRLLGAAPADAVDAANALIGVLAEWEGDLARFDPEEIPETPFVHVANRVVIDDSFTVEQDYLDTLSRRFDAALGAADLADAASKDFLDEWVNRNTAGLIEESTIEPNADLRLVLQNAVLFGAAWAQPFEEAMTFPSEFAVAGGSAVDVDTMHEVLTLAYAEEEGWAAVTMPYTSGLSAMVVLPPEGVDPLDGGAEALAEISGALGEALANASPAMVDVSLPVLDTEAKLDLVPALMDLGYAALFDENARPLSGISEEAVAIGQAAQQAVLRINEEGTVAAAVTEIGAEATSAQEPPPLVLEVDRPFLFVITEDSTGWNLFQSVIRDPRE